MAMFTWAWLIRKRQFRSLTGVEAETFRAMVERLRPHWRKRVVAVKNRSGRPWGVGALEDHLLVLLIAYADKLLDDPKIRKQAKADLPVRVAAWENRKADAKGNVASTPKPTLEDCAAEIERKRLFQIIE